jgi:ABC-type sugar transport system permease subunit
MPIPALILVAIFIGYPIFRSVFFSFSSWDGIGAPSWVGLSNYQNLLGSDPFWISLRNNIAFAVVITAGSVAIGTLLAAAIHSEVLGAKFFKVVYFLPFMIPQVISVVFWQLAFQPAGGVVNPLLGAMHLGGPYLWLADPDLAKVAVVFVNIWTQVGFCTIFVLAAMEAIPPEIEEAATIDGANTVRRLRYIILPVVRPVIATVGLLEFIFAFNSFTVVFAMTGGGPYYATSVLSVLLYVRAFTLGDFGYAGAVAVVSVGVIGLLALAFMRLFRPASVVIGDF